MNAWGYPIGFTSPSFIGSGTNGPFFPYGATFGSDVKFADGTEAAPSVTFTSNQTTGIRHATTGGGDEEEAVSISVNGSESIAFGSTTTRSRKRLRVPNGTSTDPGFSFDTFPETGFFAYTTSGALATTVNGVITSSDDGNHRTEFNSLYLPNGTGGGFRITNTSAGFYNDPDPSLGGVSLIDDNGQSFLTSGRGFGKTSILRPLVIFTDGSAASPSYSFTADTTTGLYRNSTDSSLCVTVTGTNTTEFLPTNTSFKKRIILPITATDPNTDPSLSFIDGGWISKDQPVAGAISIGAGDYKTTPCLTVRTSSACWKDQPLLAMNFIQWTGPNFSQAVGSNVNVIYSAVPSYVILGMVSDFGSWINPPFANYNVSNFTPHTSSGAYIEALNIGDIFRVTAVLDVSVNSVCPYVYFAPSFMNSLNSYDTDVRSTGAATKVVSTTDNIPRTISLNATLVYSHPTYPYLGILCSTQAAPGMNFSITSFSLTIEYLGNNTA